MLSYLEMVQAERRGPADSARAESTRILPLLETLACTYALFGHDFEKGVVFAPAARLLVCTVCRDRLALRAIPERAPPLDLEPVTSRSASLHAPLRHDRCRPSQLLKGPLLARQAESRRLTLNPMSSSTRSRSTAT